jgi:hypothetical protein
VSHRDTLRTISAYNRLVNAPLSSLRDTEFNVQLFALPPVADGTEVNLYFAYRNGVMAIDQNQDQACAVVGAPVDHTLTFDYTFTIRQRMIVSGMRGARLAVGAGLGARHVATNRVNGATINSELWVTQAQTGCTVLLLDWGNHQFSMFHIEPSRADQFNRFGQGLIGASGYAGAAYKNAWLRSEANTVVNNSAIAGAMPRQYIMVQSEFSNVGGWTTHVIGVRDVNDFLFYRQRTHAGTRAMIGERLEWTTWRSYVPWWSTY